MRIKYFALFLFVFSFISCVEKSGEEQLREWIAKNAVPIKTVQPGSTYDDLQPLKKMIGDARIVSLGEPTHGNREVFLLKHRMIEYLVEELGFNIFTLECPFAEAYDINRYVVDGIGDPEKALAGIYFWTWDTEEVLGLIEWMRAYNVDPAHDKKVKFYGFDVQDPERAARVMLEYLYRVDPELWQAVKTELEILEIQFSDAFGLGRRPFIPEESDEASMSAIKWVMNAFQQNKQEYIAITTEKEWLTARQHARQVEIWIEACANDGEKYVELRDKAQAENIDWLLQQEGSSSKAIVWAHNCHVSNAAPKDDINMHGYYLRQMYGDKLKIFGLFYNQGGFKAIDAHKPSRGMHNFSVDKAPQGTLESMLACSGESLAMLDMQNLPEKGPVRDWFYTKKPSRHSGGGYDENNPEDYFWSYIPAVAYDGLVYLDTTTPVRSIDDTVYDYMWMLDRKQNTPTNLDFESDSNGEKPEGWMVWSKFERLGVELLVTDINPYQGKYAAMIHRPKGIRYGEITPSLTQRIDASQFKGKTIRIKAACRSEVQPQGFAFFRFTIDPDMIKSAHDGLPPLFDSLDGVRIDSVEWKLYELEIKVPSEAGSITYGIYLRDPGTVWIDAVQIEVVD